MGEQPKVSIIVPIYNVEKYIDNCLNSLLFQTLKEIEIVCVDDGSVDGCRDIIKKYADKDDRIKPVFLDGNKGTLIARKRGVLESTGKYILFCDGDDMLDPKAAQVVWDEMQKSPVDILQFATETIFSETYEEDEKASLTNILKPCLQSIRGDICEACFQKRQFSYTLWNKAYLGELCRKAFLSIKDKYAIVSEDLYTFFVISYFAQSYRGIRNKLYIYNFGLGVTGNNYLGYKEFEKQCNAVTIIPLMNEFLEEQAAEDKYYNIYHDIKKDIITGIVYQWRNKVSLSVADKGYLLMLNHLGASTLVSELARQYENDQLEVLRRLPSNRGKFRKGHAVKKVGVYYHRLRNGGVEKVLSELVVKWKNMGYDVLLFTDEEPTDEDYIIPDDIQRIVLPSFITSVGAKYKKRARCWEAMIKKYSIDTIIYNSPMSHILLWDTCLLKGIGCNFIIETHCMFSGAMWYSPFYSCFLPLIYRMVDCVVSLSRVDIAFWQNYCPAYYIQNPIELVDYKERAVLDSKNILWVGRLAEEKQPYAALEVFKIVADEIPDATLTVVGSGDSQGWIDGLKAKAKELNIYEKVDFCGFQLDVTPYYKKASILAFTSMCEAAPVVLSESKSYGIPIVMFDLPNVEFSRDSRGIIKVPQKDIWAMAHELIGLLQNDKKRKCMGDEGRRSIEEFAQFDIEKAWRQLFTNLENGIEHKPDENTPIMLDLLFENIHRGLNLISTTASSEEKNIVCRNHEEVLNRHEEVVNRHEASINHQWEVQKWHEERISALEKYSLLGILRRIYRKLFKRK